MASAKFSGSDGYTLNVPIEVDGNEIEVGPATAVKARGYTGQYSGSQWDWTITVSGGDGEKGKWGPYDYRGNTGGVVSKTVFAKKTFVRSGGSIKVTVRVESSFGVATVTQTVTIPGKPPAPSNRRISDITPTRMLYEIRLNGSGGSKITRTEMRYSRNKNMSGAKIVRGGADTVAFLVMNLEPGTLYYLQSRAVNSFGAGDWSPVISAKTLTAKAPTLEVTPQANGTSVRIRVTPPGGSSSGIVRYYVEAWLGNRLAQTYSIPVTTDGVPGGPFTPPPVPGDGSAWDRATNGSLFWGLTPGKTYRWRASVTYSGPYAGPFTAFITRLQPKPNMNPGDYFDGASISFGTENNYAWAGAAHASQSIVYAMKALGWHAEGDVGYDGAFSLHRFRGGFFGDHVAHLIFTTAPTIPGLHVGMNPGVAQGRAIIFEETVYTGSIYYSSSMAQRVQLELVWLDVANAVISVSTSEPQVVPAEEIVRLSLTVESPVGAVGVSVRVLDVAGEGWQPWRSGDYVSVDAAMVILGDQVDYFDGDTADDLYYEYAWEGAENASISSRTPLGYEEDLLVDPDCEPLPVAPLPPVIPTDCIIETGIWRRLAFQVPDGEVRLASTSVPIFYIRTDDQAERQIRIRAFANPDGVAPEALDPISWESEVIVSFLPANTLLTIDGVSRSAYAEVGGREARSANHLLYGTDGAPASWPELKCGVGYVITLDVPTENAEDNIQVGMTLAQRI